MYVDVLMVLFYSDFDRYDICFDCSLVASCCLGLCCLIVLFINMSTLVILLSCG